MQKQEHIQVVLSYIERHLSEELSPEYVADRHFISVRQLYRDFYAFTGHSIKEYIRKRRISNACEKIKCSQLSLDVIADESGYQTVQAFHKQFKSTVGMTPLEYRQSDSYFYFYPFSVDMISLTVRVGMETIPAYTTTCYYDSCLIGIEDKAIAQLGETSCRIFGRNGKQIANHFCYEVMTEKPGEGKTTLYATCMVDYKESEINNGWNYLYNSWLSTSMFEESDDGYFEEYIFHNGKPRKLKLYLPVKKRKQEQHITITSVPKMSFVIAREQGYNAERKASEKVITFLQRRYPLLVQNAQKFYICAYDNVYECGVECGSGFTLPSDSGLEILHIPAGYYAVLPDDRLGDMSMGVSKMDLWLRNNRIISETDSVFAVYETLSRKHVRMKLYKRLKNDKNG